MPGAADQVAELLSVPLEQLLTSLGRGVGSAQAALDRHSIEIQELIDSDPVLGQYGLQASWYQIPSTQLELKIAVQIEQPPTPAPPPGPIIGGNPILARPLPRLWAAPVNARYSNQFGYDVQASSTVSLSIVPVPPPSTVVSARPIHTADEVFQEISSHLLADGGSVTGRVSINFNPAAKSWFVLQTQDDGTSTSLLKLIRVDDETLAITREDPVS
jgi:hypothetical protein